MNETRSADLRDADDLEGVLRAEAVALGRSWAREKAADYRRRLPAAEWPDYWNDADDGPLPPATESGRRERLRLTANRAAREHWLELLADQRSSEAGDDDERESLAAADLEARARESLPAPRLEVPPAASPDRVLGDSAEPVLVNWRA